MLAEKEDANSSKSVQTRVSNLTKALDAVTTSISRLSVDGDSVGYNAQACLFKH